MYLADLRKTPAENYIAICVNGDRAAGIQTLLGYLPFTAIMPCGAIFQILDPREIPGLAVMCPCGNPTHKLFVLV